MIQSLFTRFETFWFRQGPPHLLAVFRILFGGFLLGYWGFRLPAVPLLYSRAGLLTPLYISMNPAWLFLFSPPVWFAWTMNGLFLGCLLLLTIGFLTRAAAFLSVLFYAYYWILSLHLLASSFDRLFIFTLGVLALGGSDFTFSLRMRILHGSWFAWRPISILPQRLLAVQLTATYLGVGWQKIWLPDWQSGTILRNGFMSRWATPFSRAFLRLHPPDWLLDRMLDTVKYFEVAMPFGLWIRRVRWWFFAGGLFFHTMVTVFLGIWWFMVLIPAYIVFFTPEEVYGWLKKYSGGRIA